MQVVKAQSGQKGHRVSSHLTLPGRTLVLLPEVPYALLEMLNEKE